MPDTDGFDVLILGAGSGGYACALRTAQLGLSVGLVERAEVGGTCLHRGCIPTKALLHAAEVADAARDAERFGVRARWEGIDMPAVNAYRDRVVGRLFAGLSGLVRARGITVIEGQGRLTGPREISVDGTSYAGRHVVLAPGSRARSLPGVDVDGEQVLTSDQALRLERVPESVVVLGGGVIGCEFASVWASFGAAVTVVEALPRLLPAEDEQSSVALERAFGRRGITVRTGAPVTAVKAGSDAVSVSLEGGEVVEAEVLLVAVGRVPATEDLGLEEQGIATDRGFITVDERLRTDVAGVYAVGDVVAGPQLAHRGFAQGIFVAEEVAGLAPAPVDELAIPRVTYSQPEVASVGLTQAEAERRYSGAVTTTTYDLGGNGRSQILQTRGFVKLVARTDDAGAAGQVVGVHLVGDRVGELIGEGQLIVGWGAYADDVAPLVHAHPTQHEALGEAHLALAGKPLHAHH